MRILLFLLVFISLLADEQSFLAVTEHDPSSLVEGVSVITGDLYVQGAEAIRLQQSSVSAERSQSGSDLNDREEAHIAAIWKGERLLKDELL